MLPAHKAVLAIFCTACLVWSCGCQSLAKKFVRKSKVEEKEADEVVVAPEEYPAPAADNHALYRQYFLFWRTWHDELVDSLEVNGNHKRQIESVEEAVTNLVNLRLLIDEPSRARLDVSIGALRGLRDAVAKDFYYQKVEANRKTARDIRRQIVDSFSYAKVRGNIL